MKAFDIRIKADQYYFYLPHHIVFVFLPISIQKTDVSKNYSQIPSENAKLNKLGKLHFSSLLNRIYRFFILILHYQKAKCYKSMIS